MSYWKKDITLLPAHWSYVFLGITHRHTVHQLLRRWILACESPRPYKYRWYPAKRALPAMRKPFWQDTIDITCIIADLLSDGPLRTKFSEAQAFAFRKMHLKYCLLNVNHSVLSWMYWILVNGAHPLIGGFIASISITVIKGRRLFKQKGILICISFIASRSNYNDQRLQKK